MRHARHDSMRYLAAAKAVTRKMGVKQAIGIGTK
jgi:hypothetical protein